MMYELPRHADVIEALLLVTDRPVTASRIASVIPELKPEEVPLLIDRLNQAYIETGRAFRAREIAAGYRLYTQPEYQDYIEALATTTRESRLSQAALETLAIVAYRQPVSRVDIEFVRGCDCDGVIRTLLARKLITIKGRSDAPGRPLLYTTTEKFLEYFGLTQITDLPDWSEIAALVDEVAPRTRLSLVKGPEEVESSDTDSSAPAAPAHALDVELELEELAVSSDASEDAA